MCMVPTEARIKGQIPPAGVTGRCELRGVGVGVGVLEELSFPVWTITLSG